MGYDVKKNAKNEKSIYTDIGNSKISKLEAPGIKSKFIWQLEVLGIEIFKKCR